MHLREYHINLKEGKKINNRFSFCVSVGYALFSETITINGTATAKGNFDITSSCQVGLPTTISSMMTSEGYTVLSEGGTENDSCNVVGNTVTINTDMLYPSAARYFTVEMKNTGTIDAVISMDELAEIHDNITIKLYNKSDDTFKENITQLSATNYGKLIFQWGFIKLANGTYIHTDEDLMANNVPLMDTQYAYLKIKPNESMVIVFEANWNENAVQTEYYSKAQMSTELPFKQVASDMVEWVLDDLCLNGC